MPHHNDDGHGGSVGRWTAVMELSRPACAGAGRDAPGRDLAASSMVGRITLIMDAFEQRMTTLTLEEVAAQSRLPRSTAHRIMVQLVQCGWLVHTPSGYRLGPRALGFGGQDGTHGEIRTAAAPVLQELMLRTGLVVHLAVLDQGDVLYLDKLGGVFAAALPWQVGSRVPAHTTAIGLAMLAWLAPERVDELLTGPLAGQTHYPIEDPGILYQELARIRARHGLAFDDGGPAHASARVAAAIRGQREVAAAISLCGQGGQLERVAPLVLDAARAVSRELFPELARPWQVRPPGPPPGPGSSPQPGRRVLMAASGG